MASTPLILRALPLLFFYSTAAATVFTIENLCDYTVWPGTISGNGATSTGETALPLEPTQWVQYTVNPGWSGRFWPRTGCNFDASGNGSCTTGDCGGRSCTRSGDPPVTLVEFTVGDGAGNEKDFYDISLVDGYNVGVMVANAGGGGIGDCQKVSCSLDLLQTCPPELKEMDGSGAVVACRSACLTFNTPEYCCNGEFSTPEKCPPTDYSVVFKTACPGAYSYAYDDATSTCTCTRADYVITFCPPL